MKKTIALLEAIKPGTYIEDYTRVYDEEELNQLVGVLQKILYSPSCLRGYLQEHGITIVPSNYYSEIPTIEDIKNSFIGGETKYCEGLFNNELMLKYLSELHEYSCEFNPPKDDNGSGGYFWNAPMYSYSDAMSYYCVIRKEKPSNVIEIGSGFSSLVAIEALSANGYGNLTCIEPYPREFIAKSDKINLIQIRAEHIEPEEINEILSDGDILFIDSTHTVKHGSDCLNIYLNIIPAINKRVHIHVHDIKLPYTWDLNSLRDRQIFWTEQYLLGAYLLDNDKIKVTYSSNYHYHKNKRELTESMHGKYNAGGASLWFTKNP